MKKIVALVLCLALALALCTTAFAAVRPTHTVGTLAADATFNTADYTYALVKMGTGVADAKTFDYYYVSIKDNTTGAVTYYGGATPYAYVITPDATSAGLALVDGTNVTYLTALAVGTKYEATATLVDTVKYADVENCGEKYMVDAADADVKVYKSGDVYYRAGGTVILNVGGMYVGATKVDKEKTVTVDTIPAAKASEGYALYTVGHDYQADVKTVNGDGTVTAVYCKECKASFEFVVGSTTDATKKFGDDNFTEAFAAGSLTNSGVTKAVYVKTGSTVAAGSTSTTVESAKTFDAGIALYAGMALASVAGSAVVIGKKKEF